MPPFTTRGTHHDRSANQRLAGRVLRDATHGHSVEKPARDGVELELAEVSTPIDYLFESLENDPAAHLPADTPDIDP